MNTEKYLEENKTQVVSFCQSEGKMDCHMLLTSDGTVVLIDVGTSTDAEKVIQKMISEYGIEKIDHIVLSHYHNDHVRGLDQFCEAFDVSNCVVYLPSTPDFSSPLWIGSGQYGDYDRVQDAIEDYQLTTVIPTENQIIEIGTTGEYLKFINTDHSIYYADSSVKLYNNCSLCCYYFNGMKSILFTGDIAEFAQKTLAPKMQPVTVLKVPHHGIDQFIHEEFFQNVYPEFAFTPNGLTGASDLGYYALQGRNNYQRFLQSRNIPNYDTASNNGIVTFTISPYAVSFESKPIHVNAGITTYNSISEVIKTTIASTGTISLKELLDAMDANSFIEFGVSSSFKIHEYHNGYFGADFINMQIYKSTSSAHTGNYALQDPGYYKAVIYASRSQTSGSKGLLVSCVENHSGAGTANASFKVYHSPMRENLFASFVSTGTSSSSGTNLPMPLSKNCVPNNFFTLGTGSRSNTIHFARPGWYKIDMFIYGYTPSPAGDYHIGLLKDPNRGSLRLGGTIVTNKLLSNGGSTVRYMASGDTLELVSVSGVLSNVTVDVIIEFISPVGSDWSPIYTN